jgi:hypothetical protein
VNFNIDLLRFLNVLLAFSAFPAALYMLGVLNHEAALIPVKAKLMQRLNKILRVIFFGISLAAVLNAILSLFLLTNFVPAPMIFGFPVEDVGNAVFNIRNFVVNTVLSFSSWSLVLFRKVVKEHTDKK